VPKSHPHAVIDALYDGDLKALEKYVNKKNINRIDEDGYSLLSRAATASNLNMKVVRLLIKRGADVNVRLREGGTLLHFACDLLLKDLAIELLRAGCDPNALDDAGFTPLSKVLWAHNLKAQIIGLLLQHGADPNAKQWGDETALELAARTGQLDLFPKSRGRE
jgi:ankyrin repeat protein